MHKMFEFLCDELKSLEKKLESGQPLSMAELEYADKLTEIKKNLLKIEMLEEDSEYSYAMGGNAGRGGNRGGGNRGNGGRSNEGGSYYSMNDGAIGSYRGSYARGRGNNARRDSMGRYSSEGYSRAEDDFMEDLRELMDNAPDDQKRQKLQRLISEM